MSPADADRKRISIDGGEQNDAVKCYGPVDYSASPLAKINGPQDRHVVLMCIASRPLIEKADVDLRPMISLEEEALLA